MKYHASSVRHWNIHFFLLNSSLSQTGYPNFTEYSSGFPRNSFSTRVHFLSISQSKPWLTLSFFRMDTQQINIVCGWTYVNCLLNARSIKCPFFYVRTKKIGLFQRLTTYVIYAFWMRLCVWVRVFVFINKNLIAINLS